MTHQTDPELLDHVLQLITDRGTDGLAEGIRLLVNAAMRHERSAALQAKPYERTDTRKGYANGFKDKTVTTRMGAITFDIPQVRGDLEFYPSALEKGLRSERALKLRWPKCTSKASPPAASRPSSSSSAAPASVPPTSANAANSWTPNSNNGANDRWPAIPTSCWTPVTKRSASTA